MSRRIFCDKCMRMALATPDKIPANKATCWKSNCGCKFERFEISNIEVKVKFYTKKHGDLINKEKVNHSKWEFHKSNGGQK